MSATHIIEARAKRQIIACAEHCEAMAGHAAACDEPLFAEGFALFAEAAALQAFALSIALTRGRAPA